MIGVGSHPGGFAVNSTETIRLKESAQITGELLLFVVWLGKIAMFHKSIKEALHGGVHVIGEACPARGIKKRGSLRGGQFSEKVDFPFSHEQITL